MRPYLTIAVVSGLVLAACGSSGETGDPAPVRESSAQPTVPSTTEADVGTTEPTDHRQPSEFQVSLLDDLAYLIDVDDVEQQQMMMQRLAPDGDGPWPIVVLLHGGTMTSAGMGPLAVDLAKRGLIVYTPTYLHDLWRVDPAGERSGARLESS